MCSHPAFDCVMFHKTPNEETATFAYVCLEGQRTRSVWAAFERVRDALQCSDGEAVDYLCALSWVAVVPSSYRYADHAYPLTMLDDATARRTFVQRRLIDLP